MNLQPGATLLHYRIVEKLGEGGMGVVWKATDTNLDREVAIKVLPEILAADSERLARFEREAKLLASLSHPNIATVFGLHETDGVRFLAMEFVEGEDLAERLGRGPILMDDAIGIARQIALGVGAAHANGVIHRDLKPANVLVAPGGKVKVLDFGLAKAFEADPASGNLSNSPTLTSAGTRAGMILGTAAYMSPEQARGAEVDKRADIWAFGCVLYEMLSGSSPFSGATVSDILASVLKDAPNMDAMPGEVPTGVRRVVRRCLQKDPDRRIHDISDARLDLEDETDEPVAAAGPAASPSRRLRTFVLTGLVALLAFVAGWFLRVVAPDTEPFGADRSIRRLTFDAGLEQEPALSPDGNYVAYSTEREGNLDIEILPLGGGSITRITSNAADDSQPAWSPDGSRLAFVSARERGDGLLVSPGGLGANSIYVASEGGDIFLIPPLGGTATKLVDRGAYPTWAPDGDAIAFQSNRDGQWRIWRVPSTGGQPVQLTSGDEKRFDFHPAWSPDGRWIAYGSLTVGEGNGPGLFVVPADGGTPRRLLRGTALTPAWSADGTSLYFASDRAASPGVLNLWRIAFDSKWAGSPRRITFGTDSDVGVSPAADGAKLAFAHVQFFPRVWALEVESGELRRISTIDGYEDAPHLNVDGRRLLFQSDRTGSTQLWVRDLQTDELLPVVAPGESNLARWSPDGNRIAYSGTNADGTLVVAVQSWGAATRETIEGEPGQARTGLQWSPDGHRLVGSNSTDLWLHTLGAESKVLVENAHFGTWSPDGTEVAFRRGAGRDHRELWIVPAEGGEPRMIVGGDVHLSHPQWHPSDPDRILVVIDHLDLGVVRVSTGELERITALASSTVLVDYPSWSPDGETVYFSLARKRGDLYLIEQ